MSRNKRAVLGSEDTDPFALAARSPDTSMQSVADSLYGSVGKIDENRRQARPVDIFEIQRDPMQPRRAIPHIVMERLGKLDVHNMAQMFDIWLDEIARESGGAKLDLQTYLDEKVLPADFDDGEDRENISDEGDIKRPLEDTLLSLVSLAVSIRKEGLTNPITVVYQPPDRYRLETGERRWLAYHLLYSYTRDESFSTIAAHDVEQVDVWRQAAENNARSSLNAISRARQLSVLLMDLLSQEKQISFTPYDGFTDELGFYAQVADGEEYRIPRNSADRLLNAVGLKSKKQLREYRALLRLPKQVWRMADDLNWKERFIRDMQSQARDDNQLIEWAVYEAAKSGYSVPTGTVSPKRGTGTVSETPAHRSSEPPVVGTPQYAARFQKLMNRARLGKDEAHEQAMACIQEMQLWLDEQKRTLYQNLKKK